MTDLRKQYLEMAERNIVRSDTRFEERVVRELLGTLGYQPGVLTGMARSHGLRFDWFNEAFESFPVFLHSVRECKISAESLFLRITKTPVWEEFFAARAEAPKGKPVVVVFRVHGLGVYVAHDLLDVDPVGGFTRLVRFSRDGSRRICLESLKSFILLMKEVGSAPES